MRDVISVVIISSVGIAVMLAYVVLAATGVVR